MKYGVKINFFKKLLNDLYMHNHVIEDPFTLISPETDLKLRNELWGVDNYVDFLENDFIPVKPNTVYRFFDEYDCHYIFLQINEKARSYLFIGPYLLEAPSREKILSVIKKQLAPEDKFTFLEQYYGNLPIIEDENLLLTMTSTLAKEIWSPSAGINMEYVDYVIPDRYSPVPVSLAYKNSDGNVTDLAALEQNYANENLLMEAVKNGQLHKITAVASAVVNNGTEQRSADSLRDRKNYLIILKTLLRKAAEYGGVHPLHVHRISSQYAREIESARTLKQCLHLQQEMMINYCQLVKRRSLSKYSPLVSRAVTLIQFDLTADLSLKNVAKKLNANPSYLSDIFHREYGCTLTDFINGERMDKSAQLLKSTGLSVQEIAAECGILDSSYFIKLFKKHTGLTPVKYRSVVKN